MIYIIVSQSVVVMLISLKFPRANFVDAYMKYLVDSRSGIRLIELPEVETPSQEIFNECLEYYITLFVESLVPHVRNIVSDIVSSRSMSESVQVTGVVVDICCVSMIEVAKEFNLPSFLFLTFNPGFMGLMLHLTTRHDQTGTVFELPDSQLLIPGFRNPVPVSVLPKSFFGKYGYSSTGESVKRVKDIDGIIVNTFSELEPYAVNLFPGCSSPRVYTVGPMLQLKTHPNPDFNEGQSQKILKWLDAQSESSVVYLSFGSGGNFSPEQVKEMAIGLELSEFKFLWCLRVSSSKYLLDNRSANEDDFPDGFMERIKGRGMICGWCSQVEVLAHKAIGWFVSHCGWNSILESLWFGVPMVTWPLYAEQQLNAFQLVKELRLAVELRLDSRLNGELVMADEIARAIRCVMDVDCEVRKKVKEMPEISRKSLMEGGSSSVALGQFIDLNL